MVSTRYDDIVTPDRIPEGSKLLYRGEPDLERYMHWRNDHAFVLVDNIGKPKYRGKLGEKLRWEYHLVTKGPSSKPKRAINRRCLLL